MKNIIIFRILSPRSYLSCLRILIVFCLWVAVSRVPLEAQVLHWISGGVTVRHDVFSGATTNLTLPGSAVTLSSDVLGNRLFHFRVPFTLVRSDLDGLDVLELTSYPFGFIDLTAVASIERVFWINEFNGQLVSVDFQGLNPDVVGGMFGASGIAADEVDGYLYMSFAGQGAIRRYNLQGSNPVNIIGSGLNNPRDVQLDQVQQRLFWINGAGDIQRRGIAGGPIETVVPAGAVPGFIEHFVVDDVFQQIYLGTSVGTVWQMTTDGTLAVNMYSGNTSISELTFGYSTACVPGFIRGDVNDDGLFNIADVVRTLEVLFVQGSQSLSCEVSADANDDEQINVADAIYSLSALFVAGNPPLSDPHPNCGVDPTPGTLGCEVSTICPCP